MLKFLKEPSSWAGAGVLGAVLNTLAASGVPTTATGWATILVSVIAAVGAVVLREVSATAAPTVPPTNPPAA